VTAERRIARRAIVRGRVQGVFYRATVREAAERHGVGGWAANRPDGSVEVVLEGEPAAVEAVLDVCRRGPAGAHVDSVDVTEIEPAGLDRFETR
jgi:acylphosphatase